MRILGVLLLAACSGETVFVAPADVDDGWIRAAVSDAWATVGVQAPTDYTLLFLPPDVLADACEMGDLEPGTQLGGCAPLKQRAVLVNGDTAPEQQIAIAMHELGHLMRGDRRHLACSAEADRGTEHGDDVMCSSNAGPGGMPTARDAAFVR